MWQSYSYLFLLCPHFTVTNANRPLEMPQLQETTPWTREGILIQQTLIIYDLNMSDFIAISGSNFYMHGCYYMFKYHLGFSKKIPQATIRIVTRPCIFIRTL